MIDDYFSIQVFLIVLRETLESAIIISVLLAFVHQNFSQESQKKNELSYRSIESVESNVDIIDQEEAVNSPGTNADVDRFLKVQIWLGGLLGLVSCLVLGAGILWVFYVLGNDLWSVTEHYWEGTFSIIASIIISVMGVKILRVNRMQEKWKKKLLAAIYSSNYLGNPNTNATKATSKYSIWSEKYFMFVLPFVTTLREGMEAIVFIGGIGINENTSIWAILNALILAMLLGSFIGFLLYRLGNSLSLQWFLVSSSLLLYLVAAGLFSKGVWNFELQRFIDLCDGFDVSETGNGPGSYDITNSIWHVNCCNGEIQEDGAFWMIFTAVLGWTNSATYGSVLAYNFYWIAIMLAFGLLIYEEKYGKLPIPESWQQNRIKKRSAYSALAAEPSQSSVVEPRDSVSSLSPLQG